MDKYRRILRQVINEMSNRLLLNEITIKDKFEKEKTKTKWSNPRDFQRICQSDPTYNREKDIVGKYTNWLLMRLNNLSDLERVRVPLEWYADGMKRGILQRQGINPDINAYKSVDEFISVMQGIMKSGDEPMQSASEMNNREKFAGQFKLVGQSRYWEVISPLTFEAERWFGRETKWCTVANEHYFDRYGGEKGRLFIFYPKNGDLETRIQVHFRTHSYFDVNDWGYDNIPQALASHNSDENSIADGVALANKLWRRLKLKYIKFSEVPKLLAQGVDPKEIFDYVGNFKEGFTRVQLNSKWNFINTERQFLSPQWFDCVYDFSEGFAVVKLNDKWNFINTEGQFLYKPNSPDQWFDKTNDFKNGFGIVEIDKKQNVINTNGQILLSQWYDRVESFSEGFMVVKLDDKENIINTNGQLLSPMWFDGIQYFHDDVALCYNVKDGDFEYNFISKKNGLLSSKCFLKAYEFREGFGIVNVDVNKWNFINKEGQYLSSLWFEGVHDFHEGLAAVQLYNKWNFINREGRYLSPKWFDRVDYFYYGFTKVKLSNKWNFINREGQLISPQWFDDVKKVFYDDGIACVELNDKWNIINTEGQFLYKPNDPDQWFDYIGNFSEGFALVELNDKWYHLRSDGVLCDDETHQPLSELNESRNYRRILRQVINEELSKKEVEDIVSNELDRKFKSRDFERLINSITADAMSEFFDRLWMKKQFIKDCIKN